MIAFACAVVLMVLLGVKLVQVERTTNTYETFFTLIIQNIKALSKEVLSIENNISQHHT